MAVIRTDKITKTYEDNGVPVTALHEVTLSIEQGEFAAIVGPSGSGKTTLLNILGGLDKPTSGSVVVNERDVATMRAGELIGFRLHHIGFVFQAFNLIPVLTARENVEFIMLLQKRPKVEREARAEELLHSVGLDAEMDRRPSELSGGQQQRVAVARALASMPSYVLADEPTANLDSASAENLLDIMERLNREHGMTFLFSTHDPRVMKRARRVITLEDGRVASDESVKEAVA
ncbi:ABC transporter ATP-binding protein [bacterium]|nr:ABC transporter ATP-binding protein [bacterium]MBU1984876.1 ABC transporter ATP-binding protein [bacterium]